MPIDVQSVALKFTVINPVQSENAESPTEVTELGIVTEVKPVQPENAEASIVITDSGIVTEVKPVHS